MTSTALPGEQSYTAARAIVTRTIADEMILLSLETGIYYSFNAVGAFMWTQLRAGKSPAATVAEVVTEYEVALEDATRDVYTFLDELIRQGLLVAQ